MDFLPKHQQLPLALFLGGVCLYAVRSIMSLAIIPMQDELGWDKTTSGIVLSAFFLGYMTTQVLAGIAADKYGGFIVLSYATIGWLACTLCLPFVASVSTLAVVLVRFLTGMCQGSHYPSMMRILAHDVPAEHRETSTSIACSGAYIGTIFCGSVGAILIQKYSWQTAIYTISFVTFMWWSIVWRHASEFVLIPSHSSSEVDKEMNEQQLQLKEKEIENNLLLSATSTDSILDDVNLNSSSDDNRNNTSGNNESHTLILPKKITAVKKTDSLLSFSSSLSLSPSPTTSGSTSTSAAPTPVEPSEFAAIPNSPPSITHRVSEINSNFPHSDELVSVSPTPPAKSFYSLFKHMAVWSLLVAHVCCGAYTYVMISWLPTYLAELSALKDNTNSSAASNLTESQLDKAHGHSHQQSISWVANVLPWLSMFIFTVACGSIAQMLSTKRMWSTTKIRKVMQGIALFGPAICLLVLSQIHTVELAVLLISITLGCGGFSSSGSMSNPQDIAPFHAGKLFGIINSASALVGVIFVSLTGQLLQSTGSWSVVFTSISLLCAVGGGLFTLFGTARPLL